MKFSATKASFLSALAHANATVERRTTVPILANVLIRARNGDVTVVATDMEIEHQESFSAEIVSDGETTVACSTLFDIVRKMPDGQIVVGMDNGSSQVQVSSGRSRFKLQCLNPDDFPSISSSQSRTSYDFMSSKDFASLVESTRFAISTEETRYYLNGIYFHRVGEDLRAAATDGHRLARAEKPSSVKVPSAGVIVPRKAVGIIGKLLEEAGGDVGILISDNKISLQIDRIILTSKLIDGTFPDYTRVIPDQNDVRAVMDSETLKRATDRVSAVSTDKSKAVALRFSNGNCTVSAESETGEASDDIDAEFSAPNITIGFNARYLLDALAQVKGKITISMHDAAAPALITEPGDDSRLFVVMPMRV